MHATSNDKKEVCIYVRSAWLWHALVKIKDSGGEVRLQLPRRPGPTRWQMRTNITEKEKKREILNKKGYLKS